MFIFRYLHDIQIALEAIIANRVKSILTALGIIFGVAAVISMLAIGNGAEQEILEQIKLVGVNNIVITPSTYTVNEGGAFFRLGMIDGIWSDNNFFYVFFSILYLPLLGNTYNSNK